MNRPTYQRQCLWDGVDFEATREDAIFCCKACKQAYWRWKHRVDLEVARINASLEVLARYTTREETADLAWQAIADARDRANWYLEIDPVGTRKMPL